MYFYITWIVSAGKFIKLRNLLNENVHFQFFHLDIYTYMYKAYMFVCIINILIIR
jgi:hypothetical protein